MEYQLFTCYFMSKLNTNNLHTVLEFQVFLSNSKDLYKIIWFKVTIPILLL